MIYKEDNGHIVVHNEVVCDSTQIFLYDCLYKDLYEARELLNMSDYSDYFLLEIKQESHEANVEDIPEDKPWCSWYFSVDLILSNDDGEKLEVDPEENIEYEASAQYMDCSNCYTVEYINTGNYVRSEYYLC